MMCLGIESTAHTFGIGIINEKGKILANIVDSYKTERGGIIPIEAAKHHEQVKKKLLKQVLNEARLSIKDIDLIAFSQGPGLAPCLLVGMKFAKSLALKYKIKVVGVNHCIAHLEIGKLLCKMRDPVFIFTSGANTQIIGYAGKRYRIFGETLDIGIGNFIDTFAREAGLGFPAGPKIEKLAKKGKFVELPYSIKGMDVAFSGMLTCLKQKLQKGEKLENLAYSLQEHAFAMLCEVAERAMAHLKKKEALLVGGVAANQRFCKMLNIMCKERDAKFCAVPLKFSGDNGLMIAWQGILQKKYAKNNVPDILPYQRVDDVEVNWI